MTKVYIVEKRMGSQWYSAKCFKLKKEARQYINYCNSSYPDQNPVARLSTLTVE